MPVRKLVTASSLILRTRKTAVAVNSTVRQSNRLRNLNSTRFKHTNNLRNEREKIHTYVIQQYIDYVKSYTKGIGNRFPSAVKMYRVFSVGIKDFLRDLQRYTTLRKKVAKDQGFSKMTREDIEFYQKMPNEMLRIAPVLILSAIPFGNYVIFPLAFLKPRYLLCSHFWSIQQRAEFALLDLTERLIYNKCVLRELQAKVNDIPNGILKGKFCRVLAALGSGVHPTPEDLLACKELFAAKGPFGLNRLNYNKLVCLLKLHGMRNSIGKRNKLKYHAYLLSEMDRAIVREGGVDTLTNDALKYACHIRGLNGSNLPNHHMRDWLQKWLQISLRIEKSSHSLLLHCPVFLAYNHPQNWMLIY